MVQSPACSSSNKATGIWDVVQFLEGSVYSKRAVFSSRSDVISAIAVTKTELNSYTVAFLGTNNGRLLKVRQGK